MKGRLEFHFKFDFVGGIGENAAFGVDKRNVDHRDV